MTAALSAGAMADTVIQTITVKLMGMVVWVVVELLTAIPANAALLSSHISVKVVNA